MNYRNRTRSLRVQAIVAMTLAALIAPIAAVADGTTPQQDNAPAIYRGLVIAMGTVGTGANTSLNMHVTEWTTATQRQIIMNALMEGTQGESSMFNIIRNQPEKGFLQIRTQAGTTRLKYAWQTVDDDGKRTITLIADQLLPILVSAGTQRLKEQEYSIIHLELDENGSGTGSAAVSASISWDAEENKIKIGIESTEPLRITEVRQVQ